MQVRKLLMISVLSLMLLPASAQAQSWFFSPFIGGNFGGSADFGDFPDADDEVERHQAASVSTASSNRSTESEASSSISSNRALAALRWPAPTTPSSRWVTTPPGPP